MKYVVLVTVIFVSLLTFYKGQKPPAIVFVKHDTPTAVPADSLKKKKHIILKVPGSPYPIPAVK